MVGCGLEYSTGFGFCLLLIIAPYGYAFRLQLHVTVLHCIADIVAIL